MANVKKAELEKRLEPFMEGDFIYRRVFGSRSYIDNGGDPVQIPHSKEISQWDKDDLKDFEEKIIKLEEENKSYAKYLKIQEPLMKRQYEYKKIDHLLLEAIVEEKEGRPEKFKEYLKLRAQIKKDIPKAKE